MNIPTIRQRLTGLLATVAVLGIVFGLPAVLLAIGADPIPGQSPSLGAITDALLAPDDGTLLLGLFTVVAWVAWAFISLTLVVEAVARLRQVEAPSLPGLGRPQTAAKGLIAMAALLFVAVGAGPFTAPPAAATSTPAASADVDVSLDAGVLVEHTAPTKRVVKHKVTGVAEREVERETVAHTVRPGESLWGIAERHLGDGSRYKEIVDLNRDLLGARPSFLEPGWVLQLPQPPDTDAPAHRYTVAPGDTLTHIAQEELGDADRYMEIYDASTSLTQPGGVHLTDPDVIDAGWTLNVLATQTQPTDPPGTPRKPKPHTPAQLKGDHQQPVDPHIEPPAPPDTESPDAENPETEAPDVKKHHAEAPPTADSAGGEEADDSVLAAPWVLAGLTGGGVLLSGALLMALQARRRCQFRNRRPGRAIATPPPELAPVEMTLDANGAAAAVTVEYADQALRRLAAAVGASGGTMPPLAAVELGHGTLTLHLSAPAELATPWVGSPDQTHWHISTDVDAEDLGPDTGNVEPPYPLLVTIGTSDTGEAWLLNCEELSVLTINGDPSYGRDFARHLAAQLAVNPWSRRVRLDCVGLAEETAAMDERITYHPTGEAGTPATAQVLAGAVTTVDRATRRNTDVSTGRTGRVDDDVWPARMLLLDTAAGDPADLEQLLQLVNDHVGRSATSVVVAGERPHTPGAVLHMTNTGRVIIEQAGLNLTAVGLTRDEACGCALLYAQSDTLDDVPIPVDETATAGWEAYTDKSGALRREHTLPRDTPEHAVDEPLSSLLEGNDEDYLRESVVVQEDLETLAPRVPAHLRDEVEENLQTLDQDLAAWFSPDCDRPRLSLLGPVTARTRGKALAKRKPYFTELLAFLALHRDQGATREAICEAFGIEAGKARDYTNTVRDWLGPNPRTGEPHLPHADKAPATKSNGVNVYQVDDGLLVDLNLFARLRARGQARGGAEGRADLSTALQLVSGRPFSNLRENGWAWMATEPNRVDLMAPSWIADAALVIVTEALATGDLTTARSVVAVANLAAPHEESTRLCMVRVTEVEGDQLEAERILRDEVCNRSDDDEAPEELSDRTKTIIRRHGWLAS